MNDIIGGAVSGVHNTFIAAPTGVITEFVTAGNIMNQVVTGMASYSVGAGYMATGCGFGPHQVYELAITPKLGYTRERYTPLMIEKL